MKRRSFLKYSSLLSAPLMVGGIPVSSIARSSNLSLFDEDSDRVLVLVQLGGGNDGLSTLFPMESFDALSNVRRNIIIPESELLSLDNNLSLHPNLSGLKGLYEDAKVNIIQNVGYPQQNRSHFRSSDIWHSGSASNQFLSTGWMGRYLDTQFPSYPPAFPNDDYPDPFALTIGSIVSETCQGLAGNFSMALADPNNINQLTTPLNNDVASGCGADQLSFLVNAIEKSNEYGDRIREAYELGNNLSSLYNAQDGLSNQLKTVARLISGGLQSKVYVVSLGGFDTHANQAEESSPTSGIHSNLLKEVNDAITAFQDDLGQLGIQERVLGMTYSEFGRRIRSNASLGTDHGDAAPLIVFGSCVNPGIVGTNPVITEDVGNADGVPMETDFRDIYGSVLIDWFNADESLVKELFYDDFNYLPIAATCVPPSSTNDDVSKKIALSAYPNPTTDMFTVEFSIEASYQRVSLLDGLGRELEIISNRKFESASHQINIDLRRYPSGNYFVQMVGQQGQGVVKMVKL